MANTLEKPRTATIKGFCFRDALHDSLFHDADALKRRKQRLGKPDPLPKGREPWKGLKDEDLRAQIYAKVESLSGQPLAKLWAYLNAHSKEADTIPPIPTGPSGGQLYESRPDKKQSAPEFIATVYKDFLNGTFTRADLRRIDPKAAVALYNWERVNGRAAINLPTKKERTDAIVEDAGGGSDELLRALQAASKRKLKH